MTDAVNIGCFSCALCPSSVSLFAANDANVDTSDRVGVGGHHGHHHHNCRCCSTTSTEYGEMTAGQEVQDDVYTSTYFSLSSGEVEEYMSRRQIECKDAQDRVIIKNCPFCHPTKGMRDNLYKLYVDKSNGRFHCFRCGSKGNWWALRKKISGDESPSTTLTSLNNRQQEEKIDVKGLDLDAMLKEQTRMYASSSELRDYMQVVRGIKDEVAAKYSIGAAHQRVYESGQARDELSFSFPMTGPGGKFVRCKYRALSSKSAMQLYPKGGSWGLFGMHTVPDDAREIIVTEGEFDAMAAYQGTGIPTVSLPNGANSLPVDVLPLLERFEKIYLWMDDDHPGREGASAFVRKLGVKRCFLIKTRNGENNGPKDANDALREGMDMKKLVDAANPPSNHSIIRFEDMLAEIYHEVKNPVKIAGTNWSHMKGLNQILKGHRRGELSIVSGHTGVGKTTLLSQMSLDLCMHGVRTLWGSFEINNVRMAKMLLGQFYFMKTNRYLRGKDIETFEHFQHLCEEFSQLPIFFMRFFGSCPVSKVIETMEYANYVLDTTHFVLDNLQFMLSGQARGFRKFDLQDEAIIEFRKFATTNNSHISLVMHPRKEQDDEDLQSSSISGSAKAAQEADNIMLLQRGDRFPTLEIRKNRFDGGVGRLPLVFDTEAKVFTELEGGPLPMKFRPGEFSKVPLQRSTPSWLQGVTSNPKKLLRANEKAANGHLVGLIPTPTADSAGSRNDEKTVSASAQRKSRSTMAKAKFPPPANSS